MQHFGLQNDIDDLNIKLLLGVSHVVWLRFFEEMRFERNRSLVAASFYLRSQAALSRARRLSMISSLLICVKTFCDGVY